MAFSTVQTNVVVAAVGTAPVGSEDGAATNGSLRGIYTSLDAGATWTRENPTDSGVVISANSATSVVYNAGAGKFFAAIRSHGFYSSSDGVNWTRLATQRGGLSTFECPTTPDSQGCQIYRGVLAVIPGSTAEYVVYVVETTYIKVL